MKRTRVRGALMLILAFGLAPHVALAQSGIKRTDLQRNDLSVPGRELIQTRVDFAPGVAFPRHSHPGEEIVYVIEGSLEYRLDGRPPVTLNAGDVLFIPAGAIHAVKNLGTGNGAELATYIVEKGKPLLVLAKWAGGIEQYALSTDAKVSNDTIVYLGGRNTRETLPSRLVNCIPSSGCEPRTILSRGDLQ